MEKNNMISKGDRILVGLSAGPDSVCLFDCLYKLSEDLDFTIGIAHVNHGIRGAEAKRDEDFVRDMAEKYHVSCSVYNYDVPSMAAAKGLSAEEAGRMARQMAFEDCISSHGYNKIALAHNMNDLAETVILNLSRGTGLAGIAGILPVRENIIRPLLDTPRSDIEQYLNDNGISFMTDSTNLCDDYTRNKIRHNVLPYLVNEINPAAVAHIARAAGLVHEADLIIKKNTLMQAEEYISKDKDRVLIKNEAFESESAGYIVREALKELTPHLKDITAHHIKMISELFSAQTGKRISLPYEITGERSYDGVFLIRKIGRTIKNDGEVELTAGDRVTVNGITFSCRLIDKCPEFISENKYTKLIDYDKMKSTVIRTRRPADRIVISDEGGSKKLSNFMIDRKIPRNMRDEILLIADGSDVVWLPDYRLSAKYKVRPETENILEITISKEEGSKDE